MSRVQSSQNSAQHYGPRETNTGLPNTVHAAGLVRQAEIYFDFAEANAGLPTDNAEDDSAVLLIPANSFVKAAYLEVGDAFTATGSATLELGTQLEDGTAVASAGLDTLAKAVLTVGAWLTLDGAVVGATVGTSAVQISIDDAVDVFLTGSGRLIIEYIESNVE